MVDAIKKVDAPACVVAPKVGKVALSGRDPIKADDQLLGSPSPIFDAVAVLLSEERCEKLLSEGAAIQWVMDAFGHLKAIGFVATSKPVLDKAGIEPNDGVLSLTKGFSEAAARRYWDREPNMLE
nr:hypothetical protein [Rhizobium leguminosarum]